MYMCMHTYIHTYMHTYTHTHRLAHTLFVPSLARRIGDGCSAIDLYSSSQLIGMKRREELQVMSSHVCMHVYVCVCVCVYEAKGGAASDE